jgi:hypothetical protein
MPVVCEGLLKMYHEYRGMWVRRQKLRYVSTYLLTREA